jgi:hypothetical protein
VTEDRAVQKAFREAVAESAVAVADYRAGSERALNFIVCLTRLEEANRSYHQYCTTMRAPTKDSTEPLRNIFI